MTNDLENEKARVSNKNNAGRRADLWIKEANNRLNDLTRLFIGLAAIIPTITFGLITTALPIDLISRVLIVSSWIFAFISLVLGIISVYSDAFYFYTLSKIENKSEEIWSNRNVEYDQMNSKDIKNRAKYKSSSSFWWMIFQLITVFVSIVLITVVGGRILFSEERNFNKDTIKSNSHYVKYHSKSTFPNHKILWLDGKK